MKWMVFGFLMFVATCQHCFADVLHLWNGEIVEGTVVRTNATSITLRTATGIRAYRLDELMNTNEATSATSAPTAKTAQDHIQQSKEQHLARGIWHSIMTLRAGQFIFLLGTVFLVIQGFRTSIAWGITLLFTNLPGAILFCVFYPKRAVLPLLVILVGIVVFYTSPLWAVKTWTRL